MILIKQILFIIFGGIIPWLSFKIFYLDEDDNALDIDAPYGPYYVHALCFEWLFFCFPFPAKIRNTSTGEVK